MKKEYWLEKWKSQDTKFDQDKPNPLLLKYISSLNLKADAKILVPLCGKSIDMFWLIEQGYQIIGIEFSLDACKQFFDDHHISYQVEQHQEIVKLYSKKITLLCGDFFDITKKLIGEIDAIYDRAALIALPQTDRGKYVNKMLELINTHTSYLLHTLSFKPDNVMSPPFSVNEAEVQDLYGSHFYITKLYHEPVNLAPHLREKGLSEGEDWVFKLRARITQ